MLAACAGRLHPAAAAACSGGGGCRAAHAEVKCARPILTGPHHAPKNAQAYELRGAGAVMHSHSLNAVMATMLDPEATEFSCTHLEMIKAGAGMGWGGRCGPSLPGRGSGRVAPPRV
jgi:hypothetical protein